MVTAILGMNVHHFEMADSRFLDRYERTHHDLVEGGIRNLSIIQNLTLQYVRHGVLRESYAGRKYEVQSLLEKWKRLEKDCQKIGYAAGIIYCGKRASRLLLLISPGYTPDLSQGQADIAYWMNAATTSQLFLRNQIELLMKQGKPRLALDAGWKMFRTASHSGNREA